VARAGDGCKARGAKRVLPLKVSGAFHSPVMRDAVAGLAAALATAAFRPATFPVYVNATAEAVQQPDAARRLLAEQLTASVRWVSCMQAIAAAHLGARYVEVGPGAVLGGLLKRIVPGVECTSLGTADDVEKFLA
jgi:[acyl-carrier-protein] S-malonyltransferase